MTMVQAVAALVLVFKRVTRSLSIRVGINVDEVLFLI
jgi:hypothetical protein